mgnify:CR=1 FL=1
MRPNATPSVNGWLWLRDTEKRERLAVAVLGFVFGWIIASHYGLSGYTLWLRWKAASGIEPWRSAALAADPAVGQKVSLPALPDIDGKRVSLPLPRGYTGLVFMTDPRSCQTNSTLRSIKQKQATGKFARLNLFIVVPTYHPEQARRYWQEVGKDFHILLDAEARLARALNVVFENRAYLFDSSSRLLYVTRFQQDGEEIERDVLRIIAGGQQR